MSSASGDELTKERVIHLLRKHLPELRTRYGVKRIALYGSFARGQGKRKSDVDLLVDLEQPLGLRFVSLADDIESLLGRKVDIATLETFYRMKRDPRKHRLATAIEKDMLYVE